MGNRNPFKYSLGLSIQCWKLNSHNQYKVREIILQGYTQTVRGGERPATKKTTTKQATKTGPSPFIFW